MRARLLGNRAAAIAVAIALACAGVIAIGFATPARADTSPPQDGSGTPTTVSADALPTVQQNGVVWSETTVGNTVYATGSFSQTWPAGQSANATNQTPRANLLAFDIRTGELIASFNHSLNAQGLGVTASPDGSRVYVVGDFTAVDGQTRNHIAAFDTTTGALISSFRPSIGGSTAAVTATNSTVYVGGNFLSVGGVARTRLAAFGAADGSLLSWAPTADDNKVTAIVLSPDGSRVIVGGRFSTINGATVYGLGAVDATSGASVPFAMNNYVRDYTTSSSCTRSGSGAGITSLTVDANQVYGTGFSYYCGNFEGRFAADPNTGNPVWINNCHGDSYDTVPIGRVLYSVSHDHDCSQIGAFPDTNGSVWHRAMAESTYASGGTDSLGLPAANLLAWWPELAAGSVTGQKQAGWAITGNSDYIAIGGEFPTVNGTAQSGLVRFAVPSIAPDKVGPIPSDTLTPTVMSLRSGTARVAWTGTWDRDNTNLTYNVLRDGGTTPIYSTTRPSTFWQLPSLGFTDTGLTPGSTHTYRVQVIDPNGNRIGSGTSSPVTIGTTVQSAYAQDVIGAGASNYWRLGEASGTTGYDYAGYSDLAEGSGVGHGALGAIAGDADTAASVDGTTNGEAATQTAVAGPNTFSIGAWIKTTTNRGGKIIGFGNATLGKSSSSFDRQIYMDNAGHLIFGVYNGGAYTATTTKTYNDGVYHQVVATLSGAGLVLYVDGRKVATNQGTTAGQSYNGYWRIGGDNLSGWPSAPSSNTFAGTIDEVAIYPSALTLGAVQQQYSDAGGTVSVPPAPTDAYGKAVYADSPDLYWRLDDASGPSAADASPNGVTGTYSGGVTYRAASPVTGSTGTGVTLNGSNGLVVAGQPVTNPTVYSEELWFNTRTTKGGKLIGFGNAASGTSSSYDRHVWMLDNGQLSFGVYTGQQNTITSPSSYNDGKWHQVVATQGTDGMKLYVDGQLVGTNPQTKAQNYTGYWRVGGDNTWGGNSSNFFAGTVDEVAVYPTALSAAQVAKHYSASSVAANLPPTAAFSSSCTNLACTFDGTPSSDADGTVASYAWNFGDGTSGAGATAKHTFAAAGSPTVTLTVTDDKGAKNVVSHQVSVAPAPNVTPTASFAPACTGLSCTFDGTASSDADGSVTSYTWQFGDGATATGATAKHDFAVAGDYAVTLTVTDNSGATNSSTTTLSPRPAANPNTTPYATDTFARTASAGLGTADTGGAWTSAGNAAGQSVSGGVASLAAKAGQTTAAYLPNVSTTDSDVTATVAADQAASGGFFMDVLGRRVATNLDYRARVRLYPNGSVTGAVLAVNGSAVTGLGGEKTVTGLTYTAGMKLNVRLQVTGTSPTTVRLKIWPAGSAEPGDWLSTATDSTSALQAAGSVGLSDYLPGAATNGPMTMQVSAFGARPSITGPTASFTTSCTGLTCSADATASAGAPAGYQWGWGDGTSGTGATASHSFGQPGTYRITLTVTDRNGSTDVTTRSVTVTA